MQVFTKKRLILIIAILFISAGLYAYFWYRGLYPSTDDAYVHANVVKIAPRIDGQVATVNVQNNQYVKQGQVLFTLETKQLQNQVDEADAALEMAKQQVNVDTIRIKVAQARLNRAKSDLELKEKHYKRIKTLVDKGQSSVASGDEAKGGFEGAASNVDAAEKEFQQAQKQLGDIGNLNARIRKAQATLRQANLHLSFSIVKAPADGYITEYHLRRGGLVKAGMPQFYLIEDKCWWVDANFKETQMQNIEIGQTATIVTDMYPDTTLHGYVESISRGSGVAFSLLPPQNATGNWVKVTQRFPIKIVITDPAPKKPLRIGSSADVTIDTRSTATDKNKACHQQP